MKTIGLTGGMGSGKSTIAKIFICLGVPVFNADEQAKLLYRDQTIKEKVISLLGKESFFENGELNRKFVASAVFSDDEKLRKLNAIIHPAVAQKFQQWEKIHQASVYGLKEAAIFFESGLNESIDRVIVVTAPELLRIQRVKNRDAISEDEVLSRIKHQWPEEKLLAKATFVISNDESKLTVPQIISIHEEITQRISHENF
jgi:dephospho-CoA kinase